MMNNKWLTIKYEGKTVYLTRCSSAAKGEIIIPDGVTDIDFDAFKGCKEVTSIIFPDSVINIWENSFCDTAWYKNQPDGVVYAGRVVLDYKGKMPENTSLMFKDGTLGIADMAFSGCNNLVSVIIPDDCLHIGMEAFAGCQALTSISIPKSVVSVDMDAFTETPWYDSQPNGVLYVGSMAYEYRGVMPEKSSIEIKDGTITIGDFLFGFCNGLTSLTIPSSVSVIESKAFQDLPNLERIIVREDNPIYDSRDNCNAIIETSTNKLLFGCKSTTIPKGVVRIEDEAFIGCTGLSSIFIPDSVTSIGEKAFWGCSGLASIVVDKNNPVFDDRDNCNAIFMTSTDTLMVGCKATTIPLGTKIIGDNAFAECPSINHIEFPEGIERIGTDAFFNCQNLRSLLFPNSLKVIGEHAFRECTHLRSVNFPEGLKEIDSYAFMDSGIYSVTIPRSVDHIGYKAFDDHVRVKYEGLVFKTDVIDFLVHRPIPRNDEEWSDFLKELSSVVPDWKNQLQQPHFSSILLRKAGVPVCSIFSEIVRKYQEKEGLPPIKWG